ncbi:uncharacterized aarF domain-containing protein kinase 5 [Teleopsis dalmanni]|uniref:uncharacterized aarF domain-containing protein kinase 5 n=1 Tax=Teleopsis dalmanni TaxID=139649 RepID=UPI0018CF0CD4|nr:uncharacterized aarF domain-containing protein kinase 5 [Teleopsis dalmanni]
MHITRLCTKSRLLLQCANRATSDVNIKKSFLHNHRLGYGSRLKFKLTYLGFGLLGSTIAYDGIINEFTYCGATFRFIRSLKTASLIAVDYILLERHENDKDYDNQLSAVHQRSANRLLETCLKNGGLYIKVGQGFAAINHILPKEYTSTLAKLQDECLPTSRNDVQKLFHEEFGQLPEKIFAEFDYKPVAAASLAQVFRGKLLNGDEVAIKVQYSDLRKRFTSDLGTIMFLQDIIELFFKNYNFGWILRDVRKNLIQELNFVNEGKNSEKCAKDFENFKYVYIPKVYWKYTTTRVLTLEWMNGFKISDMEQIRRNKMDLRDIDMKLFKMFAEQIFKTGFVHADPHPGNIFIRKNPNNGKAELILLDHGLYEILPEEVRLPLCEFWEATVLRNDKKMEECAKKMNIKDYMKFAEVLFQQPISMNNGHIKTKLTQADIEYIQEIAKKNFDLIMNTLKEMPRNMIFVVRNLNTVRAIGRHHGDVVDRPSVMAKHAQKCVNKNFNSFTGRLQWFYRRCIFEYCLWRNAFKIRCLNLYFLILYKLGRAPKEATTLLQTFPFEEQS